MTTRPTPPSQPTDKEQHMQINALLDVNVVALESDDEVTVLLDLEAPAARAEDTRPPASLQVVLDRSGSMAGAPLYGVQPPAAPAVPNAQLFGDTPEERAWLREGGRPYDDRHLRPKVPRVRPGRRWSEGGGTKPRIPSSQMRSAAASSPKTITKLAAARPLESAPSSLEQAAGSA